MRSVACHDGILIGEPGNEISRLVGLGFLEIGPGRPLPVFKALVLRFAR
jgi:hypothetical protein